MDLIAVGRISKPVGIRGEIRVLPFADDPERFASLKSVWIGNDEKRAQEYNLFIVRTEKRHVIVSLDGVKTVDEAESLRDKFLFVPKEKIIALHKGSFFVDDIIGCEVVTDKQEKVGTISDLLSLPGNDVWVVEIGKKEFLIPAVKAIIQQVDVEKKRITINALEGLLE